MISSLCLTILLCLRGKTVVGFELAPGGQRQRSNEFRLNPLSSPEDHSNIDEERRDYTGAGTLGDIMSSPENNLNRNMKTNGYSIPGGLVTSSGGNLSARFSSKMGGQISPLERVALTANGNLQRIFSSYYDAPVHVIIDHCRLRPKSNHTLTRQCDTEHFVWDRRVHLSVFNQNFCTAFSEVTICSGEYADLVTKGGVGLGQLFRYLNKLPTFQLLDAGRLEHGGIWREYTLECDNISCRIREEFSSTAWDIVPPEDEYYSHNDNIF